MGRVLKSQKGSAAVEFAVLVLPLITTFSFTVYMCLALVTLAQAHREASFSGTNAMAAVNSDVLPPSTSWKHMFINHSSSAAQLEAIGLAQNHYGFSPTSKFHLAAVNYAAGSAQRSGHAYGLTNNSPDNLRQLGLQFSPEWYTVLIKFPGLGGLTLRAQTMNPLPPASGSGGSGDNTAITTDVIPEPDPVKGVVLDPKIIWGSTLTPPHK